jgi:serine protease Do
VTFSFVLLSVFCLQFSSLEASDSKGSSPSLAKQLQEELEQVVDHVAPAVVVLNISKRLNVQEELQLDGPRSGPEDSESQGSGIIFKSDGYILTNWHVIEEAEKIEVTLQDKRKFTGKVIGHDDKTDLAILKIAAEKLPCAILGNSDKVKVGDWAIAIGAPFNLEYTTTFGHISALRRSGLLQKAKSVYENYLQTDAAINPGNSGGPLCNIDGEVIGLTTLIKGLDTHIGFAIPSNMIEEIGLQLIKSGKIVRPWIGLGIETVERDFEGKDFLVSAQKGVLVHKVDNGTPAAAAKIKPFDLIISLDGQSVASAEELQREILKKKIGQMIEVSLLRDGKLLKFSVKTGEAP